MPKSMKQKRAEALSRFKILPREEWGAQRVRKGLDTDAMSYRKYHQDRTEKLDHLTLLVSKDR
jgi:Fe-S cluster assembly scaffold protein SufB